METKGIVLDRNSRIPLQRQLESALREAILAGRLKAGDRILSSRDLQTHLGLSRNTIVNALDQLQAEGFLVAVPGAGTFVAQTLQHRIGAESSRALETDLMPTDAAKAFAASRALAENLDRSLPFRPGIPALDLFPFVQFRRGLTASAWTVRALDYPEPLGDSSLRDAIANRLQQTRGLACTADQVLIVGGAQAAFTLIARVLLKSGDTALVEDPGYPGIRAIFSSQSARLVAVPVDEDGIDAGFLARQPASLIHTTPSHQYPTGALLSLERRLALLDWASENGAWVIEDDYDSEFNYTGKPQPALHSLDRAHRVVYVGTFSKVLSPALRVAYLVVPRNLRAAFAAAQQVIGAQPSTLLQLAIAHLIESGHFGRHVTKMRKIYDRRRIALTSELEGQFGRRVKVRDTRTGLHFVAYLPRALPAALLAKFAGERGIITPPLSAYSLTKPSQNALVLGFASTPIPEARRAVATLAEIARSNWPHAFS